MVALILVIIVGATQKQDIGDVRNNCLLGMCFYIKNQKYIKKTHDIDDFRNL